MSTVRSLKQGRASYRVKGKRVAPSQNVIRAKERKRVSRQLRLVGLAKKAKRRKISVFQLQREEAAEVARIRKEAVRVSSFDVYSSSGRYPW